MSRDSRGPWDTWIWESEQQVMETGSDGARKMARKMVYETKRFYEGPDEIQPPDGAVKLQQVWDLWKLMQRSCGNCRNWDSAKGVCGLTKEARDNIRKSMDKGDAFWHPGHASECDFWEGQP